jgi:transcriptional antiterminator RfaH
MRTEYASFSGPERSWVVVNTHPHREQIAIENLDCQNFRTYCPLVRKTVRHARKSQEVLRPLFPGYVFVQVSPGLHRWRPILSTRGVRTLVRTGEQLSFLDNGFIEALRQREVAGAIVRPERPYEIGQRVEITSNAFDGVVATIIDMDEKNRLVVLLDLLGRAVKVKVEADVVRATS